MRNVLIILLSLFVSGCVTTRVVIAPKVTKPVVKKQPAAKLKNIDLSTSAFIKVDPNFDPLAEPVCFKEAIDFWELVYTSPGSDTIVYDTRNHIIHEINEDTPWRNRKAIAFNLIREVKEKVTNDLDIKAQIGARRTFEHGLENAHKYVPYIQKRLKQEGMPIDLALIPLVESSFNLKARSKVGALGAWQIMPRTFKLYAKGNKSKLFDIKFATEVAIKILKDNYNELGSWPLAINAYHSGQGRLMKAKRELNTTDICSVVKNFDGKGYKSASRQYYAQFLAARRLYYKYNTLLVSTK
jgi:hypothetical protein